MVRTKHTGSPSVAVHALPVANTMESAIKTQETRLGHRKVHVPIHLNGTETDVDRALVYHTTAAKIDTEGHMVPFRTRVSVIANILCLSSVSDLTMGEIVRTYKDQLWDPNSWTVHSVHNNTSTVLAGATTPADSTILKTAGSATTNTTLADLHPANVMFAHVQVTFDFSHLDDCMVNLSLDTFIQLPQHNQTVLNGTGGNFFLTTFHGHNDITPYSKEEFRQLILVPTGQFLLADLTTPDFGLTEAFLDVSIKDDSYRNILLK